MADLLELESGAPDTYLLEDGTGSYQLETDASLADPMPIVGGGYYPEQG